MGPSGSGKTTILRAIAALEPFQQGTIDLDGVRLAGATRPSSTALGQLRRRVGLVFQFHHLFDHLTVTQNVTLAPMHVLGVSHAEAKTRAMELLETLGVEHRATALPRELSGGEAQRVAIARALAVDPPLLMMDEPTASLDPSRRNELGELLARLTRQGRTILLSTHDEEFTRRWVNAVLRVEEGVIVGDPRSPEAPKP
jgi:ABC-type polar amino acid transport system ATPase subunit